MTDTLHFSDDELGDPWATPTAQAPADDLPATMYDRGADEPGRRGGKILRDYLNLKAKEKEVKKQIEAMQPAVLEVLNAEDGCKVEGFLGHDFATQQRTKWAYSPDCKAMEIQLKALKKQEETTGDAVVESTSVSVVVTRSRIA